MSDELREKLEDLLILVGFGLISIREAVYAASEETAQVMDRQFDDLTESLLEDEYDSGRESEEEGQGSSEG